MGIIQHSWEASRGEVLEKRLKICGKDLKEWGQQHLILFNNRIKEQKSLFSSLKARVDARSVGELSEAEKLLHVLLE